MKKINLKLPAKKTNVVKSSALPTKRNINFATIGQKEVNPKYATIGIVLIIICACLFSKFFVIDRYVKLFNYQSQANSIESLVDAGYDKIDSYSDLNNKYAHYTYSGMSAAELSLTDRGEVLDLISNVIMKYATVEDWTLNENELNLSVTGASLATLNTIADQLEQMDIVSYCMVQTAAKADSPSVEAELTVYLQ